MESHIISFLKYVSSDSETNTVKSVVIQKYRRIESYVNKERKLFSHFERQKSDLKREKDDNQSSERKLFSHLKCQKSDLKKENDDSQSSNDINEIILSVYWKRGKLGAAYYNCDNSELHLLNDIIDVHPEFNNLKTLINQVQPRKVIINGSMSEAFVKSLCDVIKGGADFANAEASKKIFFMSCRRKDLGYESCKRRILSLKLAFEPDALSESDHMLFITSHIDLAQESMVIGLGMLLKYLDKHLPQIDLSNGSLQIMSLGTFSLMNLVSMDEATRKGLQVFNATVHPSAFKRNLSGSNKEGLSLFGVFNRCRSVAGAKKMREIFMNPTKDLDVLHERLDAVEFFLKPQHQPIVRNLRKYIKRAESIPGILARIYRSRGIVSHWKALYSSLYNAILIGEICRKHSESSKLLLKAAESVTRDFHQVAHFIIRVIDFEKSSTKNRFTVRNGVNRRLDSWPVTRLNLQPQLLNFFTVRWAHTQLPQTLVKVAQIELKDLPPFVKHCSIIYIMELGYLLSVPIWTGDGTNVSDYSLLDFQFKFMTKAYVHYKTPRCAVLDKVLGDSVVCISDIESEIMLTLIRFIRIRTPDLVKAVHCIAELDCLISFALVASENNYKRPVLTKEKRLDILKGRHPLQELCADNFVPNDVKFGPEDHFIKILTGPNASGKSVYLKQVALIAYLAHVGSFVPAQSAVIGILDQIHSRVQSVESISTRMSAFLIELKQMSLSLYHSTPRSLIIIDEFGKGTTEIDGLSLFVASLSHFIERKEACPFVLASSHFHRLPKLLPPTPLVHLQCMDYLIENEEIVHLHKVKDGTSGTSLTHLVAKAAGLAETTAKRSSEILDGTKSLKPNPQLEVTKAMKKKILRVRKKLLIKSQKDWKRIANPRVTFTL